MSGKPAARLSDSNACPKSGHGPNPISAGSPDVLINYLPAARIGDPTGCGDAISTGMPGIFVNGKPIAYLGSATAHGGVIVSGSGDVLVGGGARFAPVSLLDHLRETPSWVSFDLHDIHGSAYAGEAYLLTDSNSATHQGALDANGHARLDGVMRGSCTLQFPRLGIIRAV